MFCAALFLTAQLLHSAAASGSNDTAVIYEWLTRVSGDRDNDGIDCESTNNPNGYIPSAPVEPPVETSTCSADAETWRGLKVCNERPRDGYDRDAFGTSYSSLEGEIIAALPPTMKANGQVYTPYSCLAFDITPDGTAATDIEHIVALAETHDSSIADRRRDIARDLDNLTIADPTVTRSKKSDRDAAEWMPARHGAWFAERVIQVTLEYGLRVDPFLENPAPPSPVHAGDGLVGQEARATVAAELLHESPALGAQTHRRSFKMTKMAKMINMTRANTRECSSLSGLSGALGDGRSATRRPACSRGEDWTPAEPGPH